MMSYSVDGRCQKEVKALGKKYRRLEQDLELFAKTHRTANDPDQSDDYRRNFFGSKNAAILHGSLEDPTRIVKARLHSSDLRDKSLQVIYWSGGRDLTLIEIYAKSQKPTEDKRRWQAYKNTPV